VKAAGVTPTEEQVKEILDEVTYGADVHGLVESVLEQALKADLGEKISRKVEVDVKIERQG
jgi:hypothetical protein